MMNGYFINAELRRSSRLLIGLLVVFLLLTLVFLQLHHNQLKNDYINTLGAITTRIIELNPELEKAVIPLITREASEEQLQQGGDILRQYGLTTTLENNLFPYFNETFRRNTFLVISIFLLMSGLLFALNYYQYTFFYQRIRRITLGAKMITEGNYDIALREDEEGDFSKLANAFNSMKNIILTHFTDLQKEKQFLVHLMSDISHQLKTPLSSLIMYNDLMLHKELSAEQRETFLLKKQDQLERMKWLIYSLLKLAKLDAKSIDFDLEEQSLNETIYAVIDTLESKATASQVSVHFTEDSEVEFKHDRLWMEEALLNILKNGIEHTPAGGRVEITLVENPLYRRITIEDTGEGIAPSELPKIFKRFYKVQSSQKSDSLGIGLALAKSIVEAHGGMIEVKSEVNRGTRFTITFLK